MISEKIKSLIQSQDPHTGMDQLFFTNSEIFHASYDAIFKKQWVFLTHLSYFNENDIFTYNLNKGFIEIKKQMIINFQFPHLIKILSVI